MSDTTSTVRSRWWRRIDRRDLLAWSIVGLVLLVPVPGLLRHPGPPMEEGFMLAFPQQILDGRLPHRDFLHLYGPGSLYVLAAIFAITGVSLTVQRLVGLVQHAAVAFGLLALLRPFGRTIATTSAVVSVLVLIGAGGLSAMAWNGALGLAVCALAVGAIAVRPDTRRPGRRAAIAGVLGGAALLYRPDMAPAVLLGLGAIWLAADPVRRRPMLLAFIATGSLYIPHVLLSGIQASFRGMFIEPVFELRAGRTLPVPPSWGEIDGFLQRLDALIVDGWPLPMPELSQQISMWFWLVPISIAVNLVAAWRLRRRAAGTPAALALWSGSLFAAGLTPQAMQRPDTTHLAWVTGVSFALLVPSIATLVEEFRPRWRPAAGYATSVGVLALIFVVIIPFYPARTYVDVTMQSFGHNRSGSPITNGSRTFYFGDPQVASQAQEIVDVLAAESVPGERLVVGPADLSRTNYNDAFFYYLFPELVPGTRFIEMDPGIANSPDSDLADELRMNDWLLLSASSDAWSEPNTSREAGSNEPNEVVEERYCQIARSGGFQLLRRCV